MSKVGNKPIIIPGSVLIDIDQESRVVTVKGPKGELSQSFPTNIDLTIDDGIMEVKRQNEQKRSKMLHGLIRALIANMVEGVTNGFSKRLELSGVGYRCKVEGKSISLSLGFSHPIVIEPPESISFECPAETIIEVKGIDKHLVGQVAANIRKLRNPDPYKNKGVKYAGEVLIKKAGKALGKGA
jgi:large subunit ribosomal protein L6